MQVQVLLETEQDYVTHSGDAIYSISLAPAQEHPDIDAANAKRIFGKSFDSERL